MEDVVLKLNDGGEMVLKKGTGVAEAAKIFFKCRLTLSVDVLKRFPISA